MISFDRLLPRSLVGRVFTLYAAVLLLFVGTGLGLFLHHRFTQELNEVLERSDSLLQVAAPTVADSAVIGDYDTIRRVLERAIRRSDHAGAAFIDVQGGKVEVLNAERSRTTPPAWLVHQIEDRMPDTNLPINVGGRDYGVLRFTLAHDRVAGTLWEQSLYTLALAAVGLAGGLVLLRIPLGYWLSDLTRIGSFGAQMSGQSVPGLQGLGEHAPIEFKQTFEVLNRAAAHMQAQREHAEATLGAIGDGVLTVDSSGQIILANPAASRMLGQGSEALIGHDVREVLPDVFDAGAALVPWGNRASHLSTADGRQLVVESTFSVIPAPAGEPQDLVLAMRDVTARHALDARLHAELSAREQAMTALRDLLEGLMRDEDTSAAAISARADDLTAVSQLIQVLVRRLQQRGEQLNAIFALSPDGFVSFDDEHAVNYVSPAFTRLTGLAEAQVRGVPEADFGRLLSAQCASGGALLRDFSPLRREDDSPANRRHLIELTRPAKRVLEVSLRMSRSVGVSQLLHLRDVTHESEVEQIKSEFLSTAAHELRTPMSSIFGFSELMMSRKLSPERMADATATIHRQTQLMLSIVNELLDLSRIEARRGKDFALEDLDLRGLTERVLHDFKPPQERPSPQLTLPAQPVPVRVDAGKMAQALGNLLSNAYKYSPGGGEVTVRVVLRDGPEGQPGTRAGVEVRDHGIGMTAEQLARVCERFYRADASGSIPGTGLGMSIVKEIVELLGGSLELASQPGEGTTATLWLPLAVNRVHSDALPSEAAIA